MGEGKWVRTVGRVSGEGVRKGGRVSGEDSERKVG